MYHSFYSCCGLPVILVSAGPSVNPNAYASVMGHVLKEFRKNLTASIAQNQRNILVPVCTLYSLP